jgi:hypothetical protein
MNAKFLFGQSIRVPSQVCNDPRTTTRQGVRDLNQLGVPVRGRQRPVPPGLCIHAWVKVSCGQCYNDCTPVECQNCTARELAEDLHPRGSAKIIGESCR